MECKGTRFEQAQPEVWRTIERMRDAPLAAGLLAPFESYFKHSLRHIHIHTCPLAAASARRLNARAYALGDHLVIGGAEYQPETRRGLWLLAHEITHIIQQGPACGIDAMELEASDSPLEAEADAAATAFVLGQAVPRINSAQHRRAGIIRRKEILCPGEPVFETIDAGPAEIYLPANQAIEADYLAAHLDHADSIFFNSSFSAAEDVRLPRGAPNKRFGNLLLAKLRGISNQLRPDIIDFKEHSFYEIKSERNAIKNRVKVSYQLSHYYTLTEEIRREYGSDGEHPWNQDLASWKPSVLISLPSATLDTFVCTAATDYQTWPRGLVLYDVRKRKKEEEQLKRAAKAIHLVEFDRDFAGIMPDRTRLRSAIGDFNPYLSEFVIIVPVRMFQTWKSQARDERTRRMFEVKLPPFLDTRTPIGQFHRIGWMMVGLTAAAYAALGAGMILVDAAAFGGTAAVGTGIGGGTGAEEGAKIISLAAYRALLASKEATGIAAAAGVLIVIGFSGKARANQVAVRDIRAARVVPVEMFKPYKEKQVASNADDVPGNFLQTDQTVKGQFGVGTTVLYDWEPHVIIGRVDVEY
jgi:Domain of unknown function (DUF4157)